MSVPSGYTATQYQFNVYDSSLGQEQIFQTSSLGTDQYIISGGFHEMHDLPDGYTDYMCPKIRITAAYPVVVEGVSSYYEIRVVVDESFPSGVSSVDLRAWVISADM